MALEIYTIDPIVVSMGSVAYPLTLTPLYAASITIQADYNNVGRISVGNSDVTPNNGIQIAPGEAAVIEYPANAKFTDEFDLSLIYITSASSGDTVRVSYIKRKRE